MRKPLMLFAALALLPLPAAAQRAAAPAAQANPAVSAEEEAELQRALARGRSLYLLDGAARAATMDVRATVPEADIAAIEGWIAEPEGNGFTVTFYGREGDRYVALYRGQVLGGRVANPQVFAAGQRPPLAGQAERMAAARALAASDEKPACGPELNAVVLPPHTDGPVLVYRLSPRVAADKIPTGGHYRATVAPDGSLRETVTLGGKCADLTLRPAAAGARPAPLVVDAPDASTPNELHVFLSLWARRPIIVATGPDRSRMWQVTPQQITALPK